MASSHTFLEPIDAVGVAYAFNQPTIWAGSQNLIGKEPQVEIIRLENLVYGLNKLHSELLLSDVIICLNYHSK